jgi:UDP-glucuronate decarboxylase
MNLGNPAEFTIQDLARQIIDLTGSRSKIVYRPLPGDDPRQRRPDISLARMSLGWQPKVALREGLQRTIAYFEQLLSRDELEIPLQRLAAGNVHHINPP